MTVGVMWEFFEFSMDWFFGMDMQKDWIVPAINSVKLNPTGANVPIHVDVQSSGRLTARPGIWEAILILVLLIP